jgi:two-component system, sensor histidine kinase and response regulator
MMLFSALELTGLCETLFDHNFIVICEPNGTIRKVNGLLARRLGYETFEIVGQSIEQFVCKEEQFYTDLKPMPLPAIISGEGIPPSTQDMTWQGNLNFVRRNGLEIWCHCLYQFDSRQQTHMFIATEMMEYRAITQSMLYNEHMLHTVMSTAPVGIAHTNKMGEVLIVNDHWCELCDRQEADLLGKPWYAVLDLEHQRVVNQQWLDFMTSGIVGNLKHFSRFRINLPNTHRDRWVMVSLSSMGNTVHNLSGYVFSIQDITQLVSIEQALQTAKQEAERASRLKSEFLANVSHEIRTPMNGILGMTEITLSTDLKTDQKKYLNTIMQSGRSLLTILNEIMDFSTIETGKLVLTPIPFKFRESLDEVIRLFAHKAYEAQVELLYVVDPDVPNLLEGDISCIRKMIVHLVSNAIKFTPQGQVHVHISMAKAGNKSRASDDIRLKLSVKDTGIGIAPDKLDLIFDPFAQADGSTRREYGGTGLGLSITRQLAMLMGGNVTVQSQPSLGSLFTCEINLKRQLIDNQLLEGQPLTLEDLAGLKVLVVDENQANLEALHHLLVGWHMLPTLTNTVPTALELLAEAYTEKEGFALVLLDNRIQQQDGFTLAETLKTVPKFGQPKLIMLPSYAELGQGSKCRQLGIEGYLTKPVSPQELLQCMLTVLAEGNTQLVTRHVLRENGQLLKLMVVTPQPDAIQPLVTCLERAGFDLMVVQTTQQAAHVVNTHMLDTILVDMDQPDQAGVLLAQQLRQISLLQFVPIIGLSSNAALNTLPPVAVLDDCISKAVESLALVQTIQQAVNHYRNQQQTQHPPTAVLTP